MHWLAHRPRSAAVDARWHQMVLVLSCAAMGIDSALVLAFPVLIPSLQEQLDLTLVTATLLSQAPRGGSFLSLLPWGVMADHVGERRTLVLGAGIGAGALLAASFVSHPLTLGALLVVAGAGSASAHAATARAVTDWFPERSRGKAMGWRGTSILIAAAIAALGLPMLSDHLGIGAALVTLAGFFGLVAVAGNWVLGEPARSAAPAAVSPNPYRGTAVLPRIHGSGALLLVPQVAATTFTAPYLVSIRGWSITATATFLMAMNLVSVVGRMAAAAWSDRVQARLRPIRQLAMASAACLALICIGIQWSQGWVVVVFLVAAGVTVADNTLGLTAVAEIAGSGWVGRVISAHTVIMNAAWLVSAALLAVVIDDTSFALGFLVAVVCPLLAIPLIPLRLEPRARRKRTTATKDVEPAG